MDGPPPQSFPPIPVVSAKNLAVSYNGKLVWRDANLTINPGEFVAVIGPNGAGKTTLFRLLLGLRPPAGGTLKVFDEVPRRGSSKIGYVPQRHTIDYETHVRSFELVRLGSSGHRWGFPLAGRKEKAAARRVLETVGGSELANRPLGGLSGGELQRIYLAEALVGDPELLLLDEPLSNLDIRRAKELVRLVHTIVRARHVAALLVAHDINPLIQYLDKVIYMANGNVAIGTPQEVLTSASLTMLYGVHVEVLRDSKGNIVIVGGEGHPEGELVGGEDHHEGEVGAAGFGQRGGLA